jgi:hypothetical protein
MPPEDAPTIVDLDPLALTYAAPEDDAETTVRTFASMESVSGGPWMRLDPSRMGAVVSTAASTDTQEGGRKEGGGEDLEGPRSLEVGGDDAFIFAWGRSDAALRSRSRQLVLSMGLNVCLAGTVAFLAWLHEQKETYVFVRDSLGNIVQAEPKAFLQAGADRTEVEIKGFMRAWVVDAFTWTPLDVEDRLRACLRLVDAKAHAVVKAGLRLAERKELVERGTSGRVEDDPTKEPQVVIVRRQPVEVMVSFDRYLMDSGGMRQDAGHLFLRALLREVPRSPVNPHGLVIVDVQISEKL